MLFQEATHHYMFCHIISFTLGWKSWHRGFQVCVSKISLKSPIVQLGAFFRGRGQKSSSRPGSGLDTAVAILAAPHPVTLFSGLSENRSEVSNTCTFQFAMFSLEVMQKEPAVAPEGHEKDPIKHACSCFLPRLQKAFQSLLPALTYLKLRGKKDFEALFYTLTRRHAHCYCLHNPWKQEKELAPGEGKRKISTQICLSFVTLPSLHLRADAHIHINHLRINQMVIFRCDWAPADQRP